MAFLESLSQGLRGAGSVLSPDVYQTNVQDERTKMQELQRRRELIAQQVLRGRADGSIPDETAQATLEKLGYGRVPGGLSLEAQVRQEEVAKRREAITLDRAFRAEVDTVDRNDPVATSKVFMKYGKTTEAVRLLDNALTRNQQKEQAIENRQQRADIEYERSQRFNLDRAQRETADIRHRDTQLQLSRMHEQNAREGRALRLAVGGGGGRPPSGYRYKPDGDLEFIPGGPADKGDSIAFQKAEQKRIEEREAANPVGQSLDALEALANNYPKSVSGVLAGPARLVEGLAGQANEGWVTQSGIQSQQHIANVITSMEKLSNISNKEMKIMQDLFETGVTGNAKALKDGIAIMRAKLRARGASSETPFRSAPNVGSARQSTNDPPPPPGFEIKKP